MQNLVITVAGFVSAVIGVFINYGAGYAFLVGGLVLFLAGGLASREPRAL